jgi:hypothetical protein
MMGAEPGFYPDPTNPAQLRYWDGVRWTQQHTPPSGPSGARADRVPTAPAGPALPSRRPPATGVLWTLPVLGLVFSVAAVFAFLSPAAWQPREFPEWVTAEWDEFGRKVVPVDEDRSVELVAVLDLVDEAEELMLDFVRESDPLVEALVELVLSGVEEFTEERGLAELEQLEGLSGEARRRITAVLSRLERADVPEGLEGVRASYLEHGASWRSALRRMEDGAELLVLDLGALEVVWFEIESSANAFSLELAQVLLTGGLTEEATSFALGVLERGFEGTQGLALYRFETQQLLPNGQWQKVGDCLVAADTDGEWLPAPCFDHHAEVVHVARGISSGRRCPAGYDLHFTDDWGLYCVLVVSDDAGEGGGWGVGPLRPGSCVGFDDFGNLVKTLCGRYAGVELEVIDVVVSESMCMTESNYLRYEGDYYIPVAAFDGGRSVLCFDAVAWERAGLPIAP